MFLWKRLRGLVLVLGASVVLSGCTLPWQQKFSGLLIQITDSTPTQIYLNDLHLGAAPIDKEDFKPGTYQLRLVPENGKQPYETQIRLYPGSKSSVLWSFSSDEPSGAGDILELEPLPSNNRAELSVITIPEGASVLLNSTTYGLSPVVLDEATAGQYNLTLNAVGHVKRSLAVKIENGFRLHVFSRLEKESSARALPDSTEPTPAATVEPTPPTQPGTVTSPTPTPRPTPSTSTSTSSATLQPPYVTIKETGTGWLRVRAEASSAGAEVARLDVGAKVPYVSTLNGWFEVLYEPGKTGYISGQYADLTR